MHDEARVHRTGMGGDACPGVEDREQRGRPVAGNVPARHVGKRLHGLGAARDVLRVRLALAPQRIDTPAPGVVQLAPLLHRHATGKGDVRVQRRVALGQHREQLAADVSERRVDRVEERKARALADIRSELLAVLAEGDAALDPYVAFPGGMPMEQWRELNNSRRWGVYSLWREGQAYPEHIARCPKTVKALADVPRWDVPGNGPTALFSILDARTRIPAHTGPVNTRLVVHLPLIVPPGCGFRVGGQMREWVPGKAFVFDDSINHEAWNDSDLPRAVLIFDIWSPYLSEAERELTRALTTRIGEWYGTTSNSKRI